MLPHMPLWIHAMLCVIVPAAWGVIMYFAFDLVSRRRRGPDPPDDPPPIDYSI